MAGCIKMLEAGVKGGKLVGSSRMVTSRTDIVTLLKACAKKKDIHKGTILHAEIVKNGLLKNSRSVASTLVSMYAKCGALAKAQQVLDELPVRTAVSWNGLIAGYAQQGQGEEALKCFEQMQCEGVSPDAVTFSCILKACASIGAADKGEQIHDEVVRQGLLGKDVVLGNTLVDMYAKCGAIAKAQQVFDQLPLRNVVSWSALIAGYAQQGKCEEAMNCFDRMQREGLSANAVTFLCILKACGSIGAADKGKRIHHEIIRQGLLGKHILLDTALVDMYAKCGALAKAQQVLDNLPVRDVVAWSALIAGYAQEGKGEEALNCFQQMQGEGLCPNVVTFASIVKACGSIGSLDRGDQIYDEIVRQGLLGKDIVLGNALVDMYTKCGSLSKAQQVLDKLPVQSVVSWSTLVAGYAQQGLSAEALNCFERMQCEGLFPNAVTLASVLKACSHSGLLNEGQMYFSFMSTKYGIKPDVEHYACMVDLFCRAGNFDNALAVIKKMSSADHLSVWSALMSACEKWGNVKLGRLAFEHAIQVHKDDAAAYVCMTNIYTAAGTRGCRLD